MRREMVLVRIAALAVAAVITLVVLYFWGTAAGIMGHYLEDKPAPKDTGLVSVQVLPPPDAAPSKNPPPK